MTRTWAALLIVTTRSTFPQLDPGTTDPAFRFAIAGPLVLLQRRLPVIRSCINTEAGLALQAKSPMFTDNTNTATCLAPDPEELEHDSEMESLAEALTVKYEELTLIHQLSEQMTLGEDSEIICQSLLSQLTPCINAISLAIDIFADEESQIDAALYLAGEARDPDWIRAVAQQVVFQAHGDTDPATAKRIAISNAPSGAAMQVRGIVVPIVRQGTFLGQMIAVRSLGRDEFGTVEADLMNSTSMMLGAHLVNQRQYQEMQQMFEGTIQSLVSALDAKDAYTCGHSSRVSELAVEIAARLGYDEDRLQTIRMAGILHDIGKIGIEDSVLLKPGRLTAEEYEKIKQHPVLGYEILRGIRPFRKILPGVRHHHESWDGRGYPDGLAGDAIPRDAQILAVADAFDAMTSDRPYRDGMPMDKVIAIFHHGRGSQWAVDVVDALLACPGIMDTYARRDVANQADSVSS